MASSSPLEQAIQTSLDDSRSVGEKAKTKLTLCMVVHALDADVLQRFHDELADVCQHPEVRLSFFLGWLGWLHNRK